MLQSRMRPKALYLSIVKQVGSGLRATFVAELWNSTISWLKETKSLQRLDTTAVSLSRNCNLPRIITLHINKTIPRAQSSSL